MAEDDDTSGRLLCAAAQRGNMSLMKQLFAETEGLNASPQDGLGNTPLHYAADHGYCEPLVFLLDHGANVNAQNFGGETPLHKAVWKNRMDCIQVLLERGANPEIKNKKNLTAVAVCKTTAGRELLKKTIEGKKAAEKDADMIDMDDDDMIDSDEE
mmetsp:Transcript_49754/g.125060  ORF Transcript_49754/g.125060 Transcript_49754/m.125060 type:complete len:156 (+) Transcript_49754:213-680(+)|eukprot:CAMPEP_0177660160 /NCGR_PEP_ID=MMETSP0447-20121125/17861_1 /TAXON_ID=0 /ORGANISM="Stygamoeba regulata, Strain BSH-02190019" /LENGTH=155 /DNA_ID=CAMNT_0019165145 /DNA_START=197 /DNA_END=664 /DNA_ORIENTATION=+